MHRVVDFGFYLCYLFYRGDNVTNQRNSGLDIIRTGAICAIMLIHMIGHTGVMTIDVRSVSWTCYVFLRYAVRVGVPLFLLLTGYLQSSRQFNKKHYVSIIPVLISYFVISLINVTVEKFIIGNELDIYNTFVGIFDFEYGYAWYVEMYIGLFLIIPFLNIMYKFMDKKQKLWLIGILSFMTFIPATLEFLTVNGIGFEILPDFFKNLYPVSFYFIGAYIAEYKPRPNRIFCVIVLFAVLIFETALCHYFSNTEYAWWLFNNEASLTHTVAAVCVFLIFYDISAHSVISIPAKYIALCSFEMYLLSYITDLWCYTNLSIPVWQIMIIDFVVVLAGANIVRLFTTPVGKNIKRFIIK